MGGGVRVRRLIGAVLVLLGVTAAAGSTPAAAAPAAAGDLVISEFRVRGPNGQNDEFIEIYNASGADHTVDGGGTGYAVAASNAVARCVIPNGTVIPDRGHYLCVNSVGYSLASYPAGNGTTATGDATYTTDIPDNAGIAIFNTSVAADFSAPNRIDAVGSTSEANTLYKEGTGYPALTPFSIDYSFYRNTSTSSITSVDDALSGNPKDTDNNAADFVFVDTNGTSAGAGQRLGAPGPENLSSPISTGLQVDLLDPCVGENSPPNAVRDFTSDPPNNSTFGTLDLRRTITNNTGGNVTRLRLRVSDIRTFPAPSGIADQRPRTSTAVVVTVDRAPCGTGTSNITVAGTTLEQPSNQPNGGGFNSSMSVGTITLATPLANGASVDVRLLTGIQQNGTNGVQVFAEALPGGGSAGGPTLTCMGSIWTFESPPGNTVTADNICNHEPEGDPDAFTTDQDTPLVVAAPGVLVNDTDDDVDDDVTVDVAQTTQPAHGTVSMAADGSFTYTPDGVFSGADTFTYVPTDGAADGAPTTVTVNVTDIDHPPVGVADSYATPSNAPLVVPVGTGVLANDTEADGDTKSAVKLTDPDHGTVVLSADGSFTYTPNVGFDGTDTFTYRVQAGALQSSSTTVSIDVDFTPPATAPTGSGLTASDPTPLAGQVIQLDASGFEPGETVRFFLYSTPVSLGQATANASGVASLVVAVPAATTAGTHTAVAFGADKVASTPLTVGQVAPTTATTARPSTLARTGSDLGSGMMFAGVLFAGGGVLLLWPDRRRFARVSA